MHRLAGLVISALLVAACAASPGYSPTPTTVLSAKPTTSPTATPTTLPTTEPTTEPERTVEPIPSSAACPSDAGLTLAAFVDSDIACFGNADVELRGWLDDPLAIGVLPPAIKPAWLWFWGTNPALWQSGAAATGGDCSGETCAWMFLSSDPTTNVVFGDRGRWVIVTGHRDDPKAIRCHYVYPPEWTALHLNDADAVAACRQTFIVTAVRDAP
jgi:hypothetical protein